MAFLSQVPRLYFVDSNGNPLVGGKLWTYQSGTSTPLATFTTSAGTVANTNPIILDSRGEALVYLGSSAYRFYLTDANDVPIWAAPVDNITSGAGASSIQYVPAGTGAVATTVQKKLQEWVSIFDFMTEAQIADYQACTLTLDLSTAIQACIDYVFGRPMRGAVYLPPGWGRINSNLNMKYGVSMFGAGGTASLLYAYGCNGINFVTYGTSIGSVFFEDFGLTSGSGTNWAAISVPTNASTMDGLYFNRLRIYGFNEGIGLSAVRSCTISNCVFENINTCVYTSGEVVEIRITDNRMTYSAGGAGSGNRYAIDLRASTFTEGIKITLNTIYGFDRNVNAAQCLALDVIGNSLSGDERVISFVTAAGGYNINDNYIEVLGTGIGIYGAPQGADTPFTLSNIQRNHILGSGGTPTIGLQLNTGASTFQWNANIEDNMFYGFATNDMAIYEPGRTTIVNNRCLSSAPTNSILIGNVIAGPVFLDKNWCKKAISYSNATDVQTGKVVLGQNTQNDAFVPWSGTWTASYAPSSGAFGAIVYGANTGTFQRIGNLCFFNLTIFQTTHTAGTGAGDLLITGLPFTSISSPTSATPVSVGDSRLWGAVTPSQAEVRSGGTSIKLYYRATSVSANSYIQCSDMAAGVGAFNLVVLAGVYECV